MATDLHDLSSPQHGAVISPSDSTDLSDFTRALYFGADGVVKLTMVGDETISITVVKGLKLDIAVRRVWSTGTSGLSSQIYGFW